MHNILRNLEVKNAKHKQMLLLYLIIMALAIARAKPEYDKVVVLNQNQLSTIGINIFLNECSTDLEKLLDNIESKNSADLSTASNNLVLLLAVALSAGVNALGILVPESILRQRFARSALRMKRLFNDDIEEYRISVQGKEGDIIFEEIDDRFLKAIKNPEDINPEP